MRCRTIQANENPISDRCPCGIPCATVKAHLVFGFGPEFSEYSILVTKILGSHGWMMVVMAKRFSECSKRRDQTMCSSGTMPSSRRSDYVFEQSDAFFMQITLVLGQSNAFFMHALLEHDLAPLMIYIFLLWWVEI